MYFIRIQEYPLYNQLIKEQFADFQEVVAVKHTGKTNDNPHYHIAIKTHLKRPALRARLVKAFKEGKGNEHMSIKPIKEGEYENTVQYMFHEHDKETFEVLLGTQEQADKATQGAIEYRKEKPFKESIRKREPTFTEKVIDSAIDQFTVSGLIKDGVDKEMVIIHIIRFFGKNRKVFDKFIIHRIYNVVAWHLFPQKLEQEVLEGVFALGPMV